ncbi:MAG: hypothetical protein IJD40_15325 [Lachnospiraceae bacterium]|nr:hypothetical protein [Lachnospiraceae bacterium]
MRGKRNKIFVDRVYYTDEENVDKINNKHVVRDIKNVSDYLRAVEMILSNYYMYGMFVLCTCVKIDYVCVKWVVYGQKNR